MWQHLHGRHADLRSGQGFSLPGATPHFAPDRQATVDRLVIEVWIDRERRRIRGRVTLALTALAESTHLRLDSAELEIERVCDGTGRTLVHQFENGGLVVTLARAISPGQTISLAVDYEGEPRRGIYFVEGNAFDPERPLEVWTQGQDDDSHHWFPCFDHPNQKAITELVAHVPAGAFALSNGALLSESTANGESVFHYRQEVPHSTYLVTLVVGEYVAIEDRAGDVPVISYVHPHQLERGRTTFARTAEMVRLFSDKIGVRYPYPRYSQIVVSDFIFGGMENTSATTLTDQILFDEKTAPDFRSLAESLIAHELAHQWWGDLVTCADWSHAWLNEGFATYFEQVWKEHAESPEDAAYQRLLDAEAYFAEPYRRPLVERVYEEPIELFDRHQYEKGACVLHLIRFVLGEAGFWRALSLYAERHRASTAETHDLRRAIEQATGRNLEQIFDQWIYSPGHPRFVLNGSWDERDSVFTLTVEQTQRGPRVPEIFLVPVDVEVATPEGRKVHRIQLENRKQTVRLPAPERPTWIAFDVGANIAKKVDNRLPPQMLRALTVECDDVVAVIEATRALARRGDPQSLRAVSDVLAHHDFWGARAEAARALGGVLGRASLDALVDAVLEDGDPRVRRAAIRTLSRFSTFADEVSEFLIRHNEIERSDYAVADTVRTLGELRTRAGAAFVMRSLDRTGHNHVIRAAAVEALARLRDTEALPRIAAAAVESNHPKVRESAVVALGNLGRLSPPASLARLETREILVGYLEDLWLRVRIRAAEALDTLGDRASARSLEARAERELDGRARRAMRLAARSLNKQTHDAEALDKLRDELERMKQSQVKLEGRVQRFEERRTVKKAPASAKPDKAKPSKKPKKKKKKKRS